MHGRNASFWRRLAPAAVDNLYVRSLLGQDVFALPTGALTPAHAARARGVLLHDFDVLLVLENNLLSRLSMQMGIGWRKVISGDLWLSVVNCGELW